MNLICKGDKSIVWPLFLSFLFIMVSFPVDSLAAEADPVLGKIVKDFNPKAKIIKKADIDTFCYSADYPLLSDPGVVKADFNGDKKNDYAVLLQLSDPVDTIYHHDMKKNRYKKDKVALVAFMAEENEKFKAITLVKVDVIDANHPLNLYIEVQPPDTVREYEATEDRKKIYLDAPSILLIYCKSSAVVIYWNKKKKKFDEIWVSD